MIRNTLALLWLLVAPCAAQPADADFNNDGVPGDSRDVDSFLSAYSEGPCDGCDSIDINRDGSLYDPTDSEAFINQVRYGLPAVMPWKPKADEWGASIIPAAGRIINVSPTGDDANDGVNAPVRTLARAERLARHDSDDHIVLEDGGVWDEQFAGEYGPWDKGGISNERPFVIRRSFTGTVPPKIIWRTPDTAMNSGSTIRLQGERFKGFFWLVGIDFEPRAGRRAHAAVFVYAQARGIVVEDIRVFGGNSLGNFDGAQPHGLRDVVVRRCAVVNTKGSEDGGHAGGFYVVRTEGMLAEHNVFEWDGIRDTDSKFEQGMYVVADSGTFQQVPFVAMNNLIINPPHAGVQLRAALAYAVFNEVRGAPIGISGGHAMASPDNPWRGNIANNRFVGWGAIPQAAQGECIRVSRGRNAWVFGNVFEKPRQTIVFEQPVGDITAINNKTEQ